MAQRRARSSSSANSKPIENAAGAIADGVAAALFTLLLAITIVLDGERIVERVRRLVPERRRDDADRIGRLVYHVVGRYIAGTLLVAALAGVVMLVGRARARRSARAAASRCGSRSRTRSRRSAASSAARCSCCSRLTQGAVVGVIASSSSSSTSSSRTTCCSR